MTSLWVTSLIVYENFSNIKLYASFYVHLRDFTVRKTMSKRRLENKLEGVGSQIRDSVQGSFPVHNCSPRLPRSRNEWSPEWLWKLLLYFLQEPWYPLNMHTFPRERDMDRTVRGTPSSATGGNREENSGKFFRVASRREQIVRNYTMVSMSQRPHVMLLSDSLHIASSLL